MKKGNLNGYFQKIIISFVKFGEHRHACPDPTSNLLFSKFISVGTYGLP